MGQIVGFALALLAILALLEGAARLWLRFLARTYAWEPGARYEMTPNPVHLPRLSPIVTLTANSLGLRGREPPREGRVLRILMCGGSGVECFSLDDTEAWPSLVEHALLQPDAKARLGVDDVHVQTLARSGFTNETLGYLFPRVLDRVGPIDVLTIMTGLSAGNSWSFAGAPAVPLSLSKPWDDVDWHSEHAWSWSPQRSATMEVLRRLRYRLTRPVRRLKNTGGAIAAGRIARVNAQEVRETTADVALWVEDYEATLGLLVEQARRYARRVVLLRQPYFDVANPAAEEVAQFWHGFAFEATPSRRKIFFSHRVMCAAMVRFDAATVRVAERYGVEAVRMADGVAPSVETYYDFMHLTPEGARQVAGHVARCLLEIEAGAADGEPRAAQPRPQRQAAG